MLVPKGRRERERGLDKLRDRVLRLRSSGVLLAIEEALTLTRRGRHAERRTVDVDGSTMCSDCAVRW